MGKQSELEKARATEAKARRQVAKCERALANAKKIFADKTLDPQGLRPYLLKGATENLKEAKSEHKSAQAVLKEEEAKANRLPIVEPRNSGPPSVH